ncbi:DHA2 family efflux MFS transporter permease subunit [Paenibacillus sp.]|jgi:EmrB/QacA subfamily drug resistance transporter|uniref:DHA2 family efflux MFS transporter permease subunit n=1 Tax=Paenibacillus sp. TaxID=58172 RepID=UPI002833AE33|nr:DHA2 family efflux MFS transporter permease subunit [Paenibacillus sp.]MDR0268526.1 DHA2 family efflux MFS transporter permease subunit [Paenibacillus sp.]
MNKKMAGHTATEEAPFSLKAILPPLLAIIVGMIMVILDGTVVNVAIPKLVDFFHTDLKSIQWAITGYTLALSAVIPLAGWMTDRFGAKQVFVTTVILFVLGSALCSIAQDATQLVIYRVLQGLGGGMVAPIGMAMVFKLAPPERRGAIMGMLGVPMLLAPALGPVLSGWLVEYANWRWIFLINVPVGVVAVILGIAYLPKADHNAGKKLDLLGIILAPIAFSMLAYGVNEGGSVSWTSREAEFGLIVGGVALVLFIIVEFIHKNPLLELRVFRSSDFTRGIILTWIMQAALFGSMLFVPLYLQNIRHFTPLETGLILLPQALCSGIGMPIGGRFFDKYGARPVAFIGLIIIATALFSLSRIHADTSLYVIMPLLGIMGLGMGLSMMPLNTHVLNAAPRQWVNRVTPLTSALQQVVVSFAVAGMTGYLTSRINVHMSEVGQGSNPLATTMLGFNDVFLLSAWLAVAGVALCLILRRPKEMVVGSGEKGKQDPSPMIGH